MFLRNAWYVAAWDHEVSADRPFGRCLLNELMIENLLDLTHLTGCRRCADVCPIGADYEAMLKDALDAIPEDTPAKGVRLAGMTQAEARGEPGEGYASQQRWIGALNAPKAER